MIEFVRLINFQRHKKLTIQLSPNVTTIVGGNNKGKSSIRRAFYWLCMSRPLGVRFIHHDADSCIVEIGVDGRKLAKRRGRQTPAKYRLDGKVFKAAGTTVPEEITNLLQLYDINFQDQIDPPFWMIESPAQVSKNLNAIVNLEDIDKSLSAIAGQVRTAKTTVQVCETRLESLQAEVRTLNWVEPLNAELLGLELLKDRVNGAMAQREGLSLCLGRVNTALEVKILLNEALEDAGRLLALGEQVRKTHKQRQELSDTVERIRQLQELPNTNELQEDMRRMEALRSDYETAKQEREELSAQLVRVANEQTRVDFYISALIEDQEKLKGVKVCPLCNSKIK